MKKPSLKDVGTFKILKEINAKYVDMEIEMSDSMGRMLINYAELNITAREKDCLLINWAFNDILKKQIEKN